MQNLSKKVDFPVSVPVMNKTLDWYKKEVKEMNSNHPKLFECVNPWLRFNGSRIEYYRSLGWIDGTERGIYKCHYHSHCEWLKIQLEEYHAPTTRSKSN